MARVRVTVRFDDDIVDWARAQAAQKRMGVGRFLGTIVEQRMAELDRLEKARRTPVDATPGIAERNHD